MQTRGFTLIELLVVIAIIGLLSSIVLASLTQARYRAYDATRVSDLKEVQKAIELYALDNGGKYPTTGGNWYTQCAGLTGAATKTGDALIPNLAPKYITSLPSDPTMNGSTCCYLYKSDGNDYKFDVAYTGNTGQTCAAAYYPDGKITSLLDPVRNGGTASVPSPSSCNDGTHICAWSVYSGNTSKAW